MIPRISYILYATDLSQGARRTMAHAVALADAFEASLTVIHVIKEASANAELLISAFLGYSNSEEIKEKTGGQITGEIRESLEQMCNELGSQLSSCRFYLADVIVEFGSPQEMIMKHAQSGSYDILVMGRHDYGIIETIMTGHSTKGLLKNCPIPVMTVPQKE
ncbi:MAG: universal stress protein [Desulfobacteraceae bacterium]|nr:universal stress protein [Desulfobacteraceae bacterium]